MRYLWIVILLFVGCSHNNHIDIAQYRKIQLQLSDTSPSKRELENRKIMRVVVLNIDHQVNDFAKKANIGYSLASELSTKLVLLKRMQVIQRLEKPTFLDERKRYEFAKNHGVVLENADYLLTGKITQANQSNRYHQGRERSEGGKTDPWASNEACIAGVIKLFKLPSMQIQEVFPFDECVYNRQNGRGVIDMEKVSFALLRRTAPEAIESIMTKVAEAFKPKGYIESMRVNGDKKIIKTTLNRTLGAVEGRDVEIVRVEKEKNLRGEFDIIEIPIGSGRVSDIITDSYCFITVDELRGEIHRGDLVRVK